MGLGHLRDEYNVYLEKTAIELVLLFSYFSSVRDRLEFEIAAENVKQNFFFKLFFILYALIGRAVYYKRFKLDGPRAAEDKIKKKTDNDTPIKR